MSEETVTAIIWGVAVLAPPIIALIDLIVNPPDNLR